MTAPLEVSTNKKQHEMVHSVVFKGMKGTEIQPQLAAKYGLLLTM
jgi:hypothetical protein